MTNLIEVSDRALINLAKLDIPYNLKKEDATSREKELERNGFNKEDLFYVEPQRVYFFKNPHWPVPNSENYT